MALFTSFVKRQSKFTIGVTTVAVVLLLSVLIPFSYNQTIGYEVAFAGVDRNLALDSDKLHVLLEKLGIDGAVIDVSGCEATCNVTIRDLQSADDAKLVKAMFNETGNSVLLQDIKAIFETKEGNILKRFSIGSTTDDGVIDFEFYSDADDDDMHNVLVEKLGDELVHIWISSDSACYSMNDNPASSAFFFSDGHGSSSADIKTDIHKDGTISLTINNGTSDEQVIDLPADGNYDEATLQALKDIGVDVNFLENCAGGKDVQLLLNGVDESDLHESDEGDDDALAKSTGELPEGFELSQNYPNPFNPTTTIRYSIPTGQHVSLDVINIRGQVVKTLVNQQMSAGSHSIEWDATNKSGAKVSSGIYLYKLTTPDKTDVKKMTLMK